MHITQLFGVEVDVALEHSHWSKCLCKPVLFHHWE